MILLNKFIKKKKYFSIEKIIRKCLFINSYIRFKKIWIFKFKKFRGVFFIIGIEDKLFFF